MNPEGKGVAVMASTVSEIAELVQYHLVVSAPDDDAAQSNLLDLVRRIDDLAPRPLWREATWVFCDCCGCSVDTDLIHPDGHHYAEDGDFYCADCWTEGADR
jgi:hypothetical protein